MRARDAAGACLLWAACAAAPGLAQVPPAAEPAPVPVPAPAPEPAATPVPVAPTPALPLLSFAGLLQIDAVLFDQASVDEIDPGSAEPLNENRFLLRRGRLRADIAYGVWRGSLTLDANTVHGPALRVYGAEIAAGWPPAPDAPQILAAVGLFVIPFGFETLELDAARLFLEASTWSRAFFPGKRDLGARIQGQWRFLQGVIAVMNGNPLESAVFPLRDPNRAKDVIGRIGVDAPLAGSVRVRAGSSLAIGTGFHRGRPETKDMLVWRDANEDGVEQPSEIQVIAGAPAESSQNFDRFALGGDVGVGADLPVLGALRVYAEVAWAKNLDRGLWLADPVAAGRDARELGFTLGVTQYLTRHAEIGVRYDRYDPDFDASETQAARIVPVDAAFATLALAAAWCTFAPGRVTLEYDHNQNPLGRAANGEPTTLASDTLTLRAQLEL